MTDHVEAFLAAYPPEVRAIALYLRAAIMRARPDAKEALYAKHNHFDYSLSGQMREGVIYVCPTKDYVRLGFYYGGSLDDPARLLVGEGKRLRHVKAHTLEDAQQPEIHALVREAWEKAPW